jgi:hypothetical protein
MIGDRNVSVGRAAADRVPAPGRPGRRPVPVRPVPVRPQPVRPLIHTRRIGKSTLHLSYRSSVPIWTDDASSKERFHDDEGTADWCDRPDGPGLRGSAAQAAGVRGHGARAPARLCAGRRTGRRGRPDERFLARIPGRLARDLRGRLGRIGRRGRRGAGRPRRGRPRGRIRAGLQRAEAGGDQLAVRERARTRCATIRR